MDYLTELPIDKSLSIISHISSVCSQLGGPLSQELNTLVQEGNYSALINFKFDYQKPYTLNDFVYARQIQALVSKQEFIDLGVDREVEAYKTFSEAEKLCSRTNERFRGSLSDVSSECHSILYGATRKIATILGDVPEYSELKFSFGPGATTNVKRARSNPRVKLEAPLTCSFEFVPHVSKFMSEFPGWLNSQSQNNVIKIYPSHGKLQFVPKNSKTMRSIGVEPLLNGFGQQGIGKYIRKRLQRAGVDLTDQTRNQKLACKGSKDGSLATIDMSSASDTIAYGLVLHLLPIDWFELLDRFRTGSVTYKDKVIKLNKFSSMGNSYTFELESLIFYSLAVATCSHLGIDPRDVSVYGDDVIIPVNAVTLFSEVLSVCGFIINSDKSFQTGIFRESCGADYLDGIDIRPFYLKDKISGRVLFTMHNWFIRHGEPQLAEIAKSYIPHHIRLYGPDGFGDGHLIGSYSLRSSRNLRRMGHEGGFFDSYVAVSKRIRLPELTDWVYPCYSIYVSEGANETPPTHDVIPGYKTFRKVSIYTLKRSIFSW